MLLQNIAEYLESLEVERGLSSNTIEAYRRDLYYFADFLQSYLIDTPNSVKRNHINYYIKNLYDKKYRAETIEKLGKVGEKLSDKFSAKEAADCISEDLAKENPV